MLVTKAVSDDSLLQVHITKGEFRLAQEILAKLGLEFEDTVEKHYQEKGRYYPEIQALVNSEDLRSIEEGRISKRKHFNINWSIRDTNPELEPGMRIVPTEKGSALIALPGEYSLYSHQPSYRPFSYADFFRQLWNNMDFSNHANNYRIHELILGEGYGGYLRCKYQVLNNQLYIHKPEFVARAYREKFQEIVKDSKGKLIESEKGDSVFPGLLDEVLSPIPLDLEETDLYARFLNAIAIHVRAAIQARKAVLFNARYSEGLNTQIQSAETDFEI